MPFAESISKRRLTEEQRRKLAALSAEVKSRNLAIPPELKLDAPLNWPIDSNGYFIKNNGKKYGFSEEQTEVEKFVNSKARYAALISGRGGGKALSIATPILTVNGWKTMGDIHSGDYVFSPNGQPIKVLYESPIYVDHKCYKVCFSDNSFIIADAEHLWKVRDRKSSISISEKIMTTEEIAKSKLKTHFNYVFSVSVSDPIDFPDSYFIVDPYLLGVWLGDGNSRDAKICIHDDDAEIAYKIRSKGYDVTKLSELYSWSLGDKNNKNEVQKKLRSLGVLNNKHIPIEYLFGSKSQRLELLKGLMDTDGTISKRGHCSFDSTNKTLVEGAYKLICSLGMKATLKEFYTIYNNNKVKYYKIAFTPQESVFSLTRKLERQKSVYRPDTNRRSIVSIVEVESVSVKCIKVDADDGMFLAGFSLIPTHNSAAGAQKALAKIRGGESGAILNPDF